jgi:trehalose utilization protein
MSTTPRVTIWNEFKHEREKGSPAEIYPQGIHVTLADALRAQGLEARTAVQDGPDDGLPSALLNETEVLLWWGHMRHREVSDGTVKRVHDRVLAGMGFIALHSAHYSKPFKALMGTTCSLNWRNSGDVERVWVVEPAHPIAVGLPASFVLPQEETYGEDFDVPTPDELVFISWFSGGEVFRSGCCWRRGRGRVFYFRPGDEHYPTYHDKIVQRILYNAVNWAAPIGPVLTPRPAYHAVHPPALAAS